MRPLVLVGPYPPPWGGIAVHLRALQRLARKQGIPVRVFDTGEGHLKRDGSDEVFRGGGALGLASAVRGAHGAPLHVHISGNNSKAWLVALSLGRPLRPDRPGSVLTVHSGLAPAFLSRRAHRELARAAALGFSRILCTNERIAAALQGAGVPSSRLEVLTPFLPDEVEVADLPAEVRALRSRSNPLLAAAMAEGKQYGLEVLLGALDRLVENHPSMGLLVFGPGVGRLSIEGFPRLRGRALFLDAVEHELARAMIGVADVFLRPTLADGDSVSVREAIALGVRVVASDVGKRPPEAVLFHAGDSADLVRAVQASLTLPPPQRRADSTASARLLSAWEEIGIINGSKKNDSSAPSRSGEGAPR